MLFCLRGIILVFVLFCLRGMPASSQTVSRLDTAVTDSVTHYGVMSCSGSICHSRQEATGVIVRQNEILTWQDETSVTGAHLRAYKILSSDRSIAMTERLGWKRPKEEPACLGCHSDDVSAQFRGDKFQVDDGIGCEVCHGGSQNWLSQHYAIGADHAKNVSLGLRPLEDAATKADICLSCHLGSSRDNRFVTHRMMAAGHPRLSFELDLFTELQGHHDEDLDYERRKGVQSGAHTWLIGQASSLIRQLELFENPALNKDGIFPEPVFFDCLACHREISDDPEWRPQVRPNPGRPQVPGLIKFNDANMIMMLAVAKQISPELAPEFETEIKAFHASLSGGERTSGDVADNLIKLTQALTDQSEAFNFTRAQTMGLLNTIVKDALTRRYTDYVAAEQAIMAVDTLLSSMLAAKYVSGVDVSLMRAEIDKAYEAVENPNEYDQDQLTQALRALQTRLLELKAI
jgi:hypothetical protein